MLYDKSVMLYGDLSGYAPLVALLTNGVNGIRPLLAAQGDGESFVEYSLQYDGSATKDGRSDYQAFIRSFADDYDTAAQIADQVTNALGASDNFYSYQRAVPQMSEQGIFYIEQIFFIKH